jgi:hypothetical protein
MFYIIYKTTNVVNGKYYIGKHQTDCLDDGYLGSGVLLKKAIKKYGKQNFQREILFFCEDENELNDKEKQLVNYSCENSYNLVNGGIGGSKGVIHGPHTQQRKEKIAATLKGHSVSEETKLKMSLAKKGKPSPNKGHSVSEDSRKKMSSAAKNRIRQPHSAETKQKIGNALRGKKRKW